MSLEDLAFATGLSTFHLQRSFKSIVGVSPKKYAEVKRMEKFKEELRGGSDVTTAMYDAGFGSSRGLYERAAEKMGMTPATYKKGGLGVAISFTTLNEDLRRVMEPRTSTGLNRLRTIEILAKEGVPVMAMIAPVIPALNEEEIPALLKAAANAGAYGAGYTILRTNGAVKPVFDAWIHEHFPDRAAKVIAQVSGMHGGAMNDSRFGRRMGGEGEFARSIAQLFSVVRDRCFGDRRGPELDVAQFRRPEEGQLQLFN